MIVSLCLCSLFVSCVSFFLFVLPFFLSSKNEILNSSDEKTPLRAKTQVDDNKAAADAQDSQPSAKEEAGQTSLNIIKYIRLS